MKKVKKFVGIVVSMVLALNVIVPITTMAEEENVLPESWVEGFESAVSFDNSNYPNSKGAYAVVKGQYAKGKNDRSLRLYTLGTETTGDGLFVYKKLGNVAKQETDKYAHISLEYLNEDALSGATVQLQYKDTSGNTNYLPVVYTWQNNPLTVQLANSVKAINQKIGSWNKFDFYFEYGTGKVTIFANGTKYDTATLTNNVTISEVLAFRVQFTRSATNGVVNPSAIQVDNFFYENTDSIPTAHDYRYSGEIIDFDDGIDKNLNPSDGNTNNHYYIRTADGAVKRFSWFQSYPNPEFSFRKGTVNLFEKGVGGNPEWNQSVKSDKATDSSQNMHYRTGVKALYPGDYAHLTFRIRNNSSYASTGIRTLKDVKYSDGTTATYKTLFEMPFNLDYMKLMGVSTDQKWQQNKWYKIDLVIKVGNGTDEYTKVDGYINGVKKVSDVEWIAADNNFAYLSYIGELEFLPGSDRVYQIDDVGFGVFTEDSLHDPAIGYGISSDDASLNINIDNTNGVIILPDSYTIADFMAKINEKDYVTVYNSNGSIVTKGSMAGCSVKVSNGFGGGVWYMVSNRSVLIDENFDLSTIKYFSTTASDQSTYSKAFEANLGGKTSSDTALVLKSNKGVAANASGRCDIFNQKWQNSTVVFEGSFMPVAGSCDICLVPNGYSASDAQYVASFKEDGTIKIMYNNELEEKWQPNRWYKIAAVMEYGSKTMKVYFNGDLVWNGGYTILASAEAKQAFGSNGNGFEYLSRIRIPVYGSGVDGKYAMDNLRVTYGEYDSQNDKIEVESTSDLVVNNKDGIIGFDGGYDGFTSDDLISYLVGNDVTVYTDSTCKEEVEDLTASSVAVVNKGDVYKYFDMGYKTNKLALPQITYENSNLVAASDVETIAAKKENTTSAIMIAVYDGNSLVDVKLTEISNVNTLNAPAVAEILNIDATGKTVRAFVWESAKTLKPLYKYVESKY